MLAEQVLAQVAEQVLAEQVAEQVNHGKPARCGWTITTSTFDPRPAAVLWYRIERQRWVHYHENQKRCPT